tara:strand:+ start:183 stop:371 length:189 start_codon:yes stop_codon:yes gene_type:complete
MKYKPTLEHQDGRGVSVRYAEEKDKRRRARKLAAKVLGKNYFTNPQEIITTEDQGRRYSCLI